MSTIQDRLDNLTRLNNEDREALRAELDAAFDEAEKNEDTDAMEEALLGVQKIEMFEDLVKDVNASVETPVEDSVVETPSEKEDDVAPEVQAQKTDEVEDAKPSEDAVDSEKATEPEETKELAMAASAVVATDAEDKSDIAPAQTTELHGRISHAPLVASVAAMPFASTDTTGIQVGSRYEEPIDIDRAFTEKISWAKGAHGSDGEPRSVVTMRASIPEERQLGLDPIANMMKIDAVTSQAAITASGGYCAPLPVNYDIYGVGSNVRPVRDSLPTFGATRGGIRYVQPPKLGSYTSAIALWTAANDASPSSPSTKPALQITCASELTATTSAVTLSLIFGNLMSRAYPELVQRNNQLALVQHARFAEQTLLNAIGTASTAVTTAAVAGTARDILRAIGEAAAAYRNRNRVPRGVMLRAIMPEWVLDAMREDIAYNQHFEDLAATDAAISSWLAIRGINITWHMDSTFPSQTASAALNGFPTTIVWWLFAEGTFLFLDGGILDLGVIRDSSLINTNDYRTFVETFEGIAFVGIESLQVTTSTSLGIQPVANAPTGTTWFLP